MGSFRGHLLPEVFFAIIGLWGLCNVLKIYIKYRFFTAKAANKDTFRSTTWFKVNFKFFHKLPCEPLVKIIATIVGIIGELISGNWFLINKNGNFHNLGNFSHVMMFLFFTISASLEAFQFFKVTTLPFGTDHLALSLAFFIEGLLFYFHLDGRPVLDKRLHILLYVVIFATSFVLLLEAWMKNSFLLLVARVYLLMLQATWFFQIAHSLYGTNPWKDTKPNREFVPIAFAWHVVALFVSWVVCFILVSLKIQGCQQCCRRHSLTSGNVVMENFRREDSEQDLVIEPYH